VANYVIVSSLFLKEFLKNFQTAATSNKWQNDLATGRIATVGRVREHSGIQALKAAVSLSGRYQLLDDPYAA